MKVFSLLPKFFIFILFLLFIETNFVSGLNIQNLQNFNFSMIALKSDLKVSAFDSKLFRSYYNKTPKAKPVLK